MARYLCSHCREVVEAAPTRFAFCAACGAPLATEDLLPVQVLGARDERKRSEAARIRQSRVPAAGEPVEEPTAS
jgi:hypothetical protein